MPRRDFQRDLTEAGQPNTFPRLTNVRTGSEDGSFHFTYTPSSDGPSIDVDVTVPDTSDYPKHHQYFVFTVSENVPEDVPKFLDDSLDTFHRLSIHDFLVAISNCFDRATSTDDSLSDFLQDGSDSDRQSDYMDWEENSNAGFSPEITTDVLDYIRNDLRKAHKAGFRTGYLGDLNGSVILTASRRISKLGISHEAMEAWGVRPAEYFVLLVRYPYGYRRLTDAVKSSAGASIQLYAGVCEKYKPSLDSALHAFMNDPPAGSTGLNKTLIAENMEPVLRPVFIGKSLQALLNTRFTDILKYRLDMGFSWTGAELFVNDGQGKILNDYETSDEKYYEAEKWRVPPPDFLKDDHLANTEEADSDKSLLLIAIQFTLRRFVKCTEFCLNCYCKIDAGFEALKPFVCSKGLCLYQYMSLGMGPSVEWEIISQPYVVDLLISFAYSRASSKKLEDFPLDFPLKVPPPERRPNDRADSKLNFVTGKFKLDPVLGPCLEMDSTHDIKEGDWIVLMMNQSPTKFAQPFPNPNPAYRASSSNAQNVPKRNEMHARVNNLTNYPVILLSELISASNPEQDAWTDPQPIPVEIFTHNTDFSSLKDYQRLPAMLELLNLLPSVSEMKVYIEGKQSGHPRPLSQWKDRIPKAALYVLQWIIGSNRSVILWDEDPQQQIAGMESYVQFRFAQGAPDKEQRFVSAINNRKNPKYPTLFAWHGSPLNNWHSIVRGGLHYKFIAHGRSSGNGIYMAPDINTSLSYSAQNYHYTGVPSHYAWPHSELKFTLAISLNEVVNAPADFLCKSPHYVVQHLDWVQPRYLFVDRVVSSPDHIKKPQQTKLTQVYVQDPHHPVNGPEGALIIPISATNSHRSKDDVKENHSQPEDPTAKGKTRSGAFFKSKKKSMEVNDVDSVATLEEDRLLLLSDDEANGNSNKSTAPPPAHLLNSLTSFKPGTLDWKSIHLLGQPGYATQGASRAIQKVLKQALETQNTQPQHELGWYINENRDDNLYQWIVELHSFSKKLQVAKDLEKAGLSSIVLEIRFPSDFPLVPPFVRIIRPRFVRFAEGGGGHITAGGAMCMELLTTSGWLPSYSIENVLVQIRLAIMNELPRPAKLEFRSGMREYGIGEAISEYKRVCIAHGWKIPKDLEQLQW